MKHGYLRLFTVLVLAGAPTAAMAAILGSAQQFGVLGATTVTNTGLSTVGGDLGVWPGTAITGFPPGVVDGTMHSASPEAQQAQLDSAVAYANLAAMVFDTSLTGQDLGGLTLTPGVYNFSSSAFLTGTLTLDAQGDPNALFVFQMGSTLITASDSEVLIINSGSDCNVYWQVGSSATLGTGTEFQGNIVALTSITMTTNATLMGRAIALNAAVTMDTNAVTPGCIPAPGASLALIAAVAGASVTRRRRA